MFRLVARLCTGLSLLTANTACSGGSTATDARGDDDPAEETRSPQGAAVPKADEDTANPRTGEDTAGPRADEDAAAPDPVADPQLVGGAPIACESSGPIDRRAPTSCGAGCAHFNHESETFPTSQGACSSDVDCVAGANGMCLRGYDSENQQELPPNCRYDACFVDADCPEGRACICSGKVSGGFNICVEASCHTDGDCPESRCTLVPAIGTEASCSPPWELHCEQSPDDECSLNGELAEDCDAGENWCVHDPALGHNRCAYFQGCALGG